MRQLRNRKRMARGERLEGRPDHLTLGPWRRSQFAHSLLKLAIGMDQHTKAVLVPGYQVVMARIPSLAGSQQCLVVGFFGPLSDTLEAGVASDLVAA